MPMPDTNHPDDAAFKVALGHTLDAHLTELRRSKARASAWGAAVCVIALALASGAIAAGTWWGYNRGVEEAQQIWATRGPQQMRQWVNLMMANDDIVSLVR